MEGSVFKAGIVDDSGFEFVPLVDEEGVINLGLVPPNLSQLETALAQVIPSATLSDEYELLGEGQEGGQFPGDWSEFELLS